MKETEAYYLETLMWWKDPWVIFSMKSKYWLESDIPSSQDFKQILHLQTKTQDANFDSALDDWKRCEDPEITWVKVSTFMSSIHFLNWPESKCSKKFWRCNWDHSTKNSMVYLGYTTETISWHQMSIMRKKICYKTPIITL